MSFSFINYSLDYEPANNDKKFNGCLRRASCPSFLGAKLDGW